MHQELYDQVKTEVDELVKGKLLSDHPVMLMAFYSTALVDTIADANDISHTQIREKTGKMLSASNALVHLAAARAKSGRGFNYQDTNPAVNHALTELGQAIIDICHDMCEEPVDAVFLLSDALTSTVEGSAKINPLYTKAEMRKELSESITKLIRDMLGKYSGKPDEN